MFLKANKGDYVRIWWDTGAMGMSILYGLVVKSGPKSITIRWPNGTRNRVNRENGKGVEIVRVDEIEEAARILAN